MSFDRKKRLETGQWLFRISGSILGFFRSGVIRASFLAYGNRPGGRERFTIILVIGATRTSTRIFKR
jgi:hypothetical protein